MDNNEENKKEEKIVFTYKEPLEQPFWLQKFTEKIALNNPLRLSLLVYTVFLFGFFFAIANMFFRTQVIGFRFMISIVPAYFLGQFFSDWKPDGKFLPVFLFDNIKFELTVGMKKGYFYKNQYIDEEFDDESDE